MAKATKSNTPKPVVLTKKGVPAKPKGGRRPGAGRPKGASFEPLKSDRPDLSPLDQMLEAVRYFRAQGAYWYRQGNHEKAGKALTEASNIAGRVAKFMHPTLQSTTIKGGEDTDKPIQHKIVVEYIGGKAG
jgi:hypothetical protein